MKVSVGTIDDFVNEIRHADNVYQQAVRFNIQKQPLQPEAITFDVSVDATAICVSRDKQTGDESDYLLECVIPCGVEPGRDGEGGGVQAATDHRIQLINALMPLNIAVRPGRIEV